MPTADTGTLTRPRVLLVCSQPSLTCSALYCLKGMGAKVVAAGDPGLKFLRFSRYCETFVPCQVYGADPDEFAARVTELAGEHRVDIIMPGDSDSLFLLAEVKDRLTTPVFPIPTLPQLHRLNDKHAFHDTCVQAGVPVPASIFVADKHGLNPDELGERFGYPLIVKPTTWGGSDGLLLAKSADDIRRQIIDNDDYQYRPLVAQEFLPGQDVGLNVFAVEGEAILAAPQMRDGETITHLDNEQVVSLGKQYVKAAGLTGLAHLDARLGPDGHVSFLECNPRIWASVCHSYWCGENYVAAGIRHALGQPVSEPTPIANRSVTAPAHLLFDLARGRRKPWSLDRCNRRALAQGCADPVLLFRRYFDRPTRRTVPTSK
ncbi:ATP-grasp domain-containing protein [Mycobacterium sp. EPa45]|uniref:ATP-grasp domain-containing protein n=1 Tax=Mycobacterium sp. EPa45 TaxID=1545728 RepID=UPI000B2D3D54|nr:ATP-grasp domain-containing protein [Mycobacterium sp. EPa45]